MQHCCQQWSSAAEWEQPLSPILPLPAAAASLFELTENSCTYSDLDKKQWWVDGSWLCSRCKYRSTFWHRFASPGNVVAASDGNPSVPSRSPHNEQPTRGNTDQAGGEESLHLYYPPPHSTSLPPSSAPFPFQPSPPNTHFCMTNNANSTLLYPVTRSSVVWMVNTL